MTKKENGFLCLIFFIFIAACIETDIYLPAFPDMMAYFSVSEGTIQKLLTWNFAGLCLSGLFYGPVSDSFGRRHPLLVALGLFFLGSALTMTANSFSMMLWGRVLQGLGSGGCFTLGTAIIFDVFQGNKAIKALNLMNSIVPFILAAAPLAGGYLNYTYGFRSNFFAIGIFVLISLIICAFFFGETLPIENRTTFSPKKIYKDFKQVFKNVPFWQLTFIITFSFAGFLVFLSGIAILYVVAFGVSKHFFPFYQAALLGAYLMASLSCGPFINRWGTKFIKCAGAIFIAVGALGLIIASWFFPKNPVLLTLVMMPYAFGFIWTQTPYVGEIMSLFSDIKGVAASFLTSLRLLLTAFVVGIASQFYDATIYPFVIMIAVLSSIILMTIFFYEKQKAALNQGLSHAEDFR